MKLILYSGGSDEENSELDKRLKLLLPKNPLVTYIPASSFESEIYFRQYVDRFKRYGIKKFLHFPVDIPTDPVLEEEVWKSDLIHLDGGNTYYFLASLRKKKLLGKLREFVQRGGVLSGESAGSILQTPNISMAGIPKFDCDDNDVRLKNLTSFCLVPFEFAPHFINSKRYHSAYKSYTKKTARRLYACRDGAGIIVEGENISFIGDVFCFFKGKKLP